jgi:hypothetical protein
MCTTTTNIFSNYNGTQRRNTYCQEAREVMAASDSTIIHRSRAFKWPSDKFPSHERNSRRIQSKKETTTLLPYRKSMHASKNEGKSYMRASFSFKLHFDTRCSVKRECVDGTEWCCIQTNLSYSLEKLKKPLFFLGRFSNCNGVCVIACIGHHHQNAIVDCCPPYE